MGITVSVHWYDGGGKNAVKYHIQRDDFVDKFPEGSWDLEGEKETAWFEGSFMQGRINHTLNCLAGRINTTMRKYQPLPAKLAIKAINVMFRETKEVYDADLYHIFDYNGIASNDNDAYLLPDWKASLERAKEVKKKARKRIREHRKKNTVLDVRGVMIPMEHCRYATEELDEVIKTLEEITTAKDTKNYFLVWM